MKNSDRKLLSQMINAGKFNFEIVELLQIKQKEDTKRMIEQLGTKYALHPSNSPAKGNYGF